MTAYADENYYKTEYLCGRKAVITSAFAYYAREATLIINAYTGSNIDDTKDIKMIVLQLVLKTFHEILTNIKAISINSQAKLYRFLRVGLIL